MKLLDELAAWLSDPQHWTGPDGMLRRLVEHLGFSVGTLLLAVAIALPLGLAIGHTGRGATVAINVANIGRAIPTLAIMGIVLTITAGWWLPYGFFLIPTVAALTALAIPPIVTNTYAGLREVDPDAIEAGRGMGMRELQLLWLVEVPLALPSILAGLRISAVQVVATATLAAVLGAGGLGRLIIDGIAQHDDAQLFMGAVLVATLSILTELGFAAIGRVATSPGLRSERIRVAEAAGSAETPKLPPS
ncbi:MAG: ABC transporter permease [Chloroflexota bacterium]|nr:ABC transporter permease [Chloroflexota bacterium]